MGRAAWSRRPPLTRERKNQHLPPSRAGRVTFSRTVVVAARKFDGVAFGMLRADVVVSPDDTALEHC